MTPLILTLEALESERRFVQKQVDSSRDDEWGTTRLTWESRLQSIDEQIAIAMDSQTQFSAVDLFFGGGPVHGTRSIALRFTSDALRSYQSIISIEYASRLGSPLSDRGTPRGAERSGLVISDILRGSMGFVLEEIPRQQQELFPISLKDVVEDSTELLSSLGAGDKNIVSNFLSSSHPRFVSVIQQFARVLSKAKASARIVGDRHEANLSVAVVEDLALQLGDEAIDRQEITTFARFEGILPNAHQFEIKMSLDNQQVIRGPASDELVHRYQLDDEFVRRTLRKLVRAYLTQTQTFRNGRIVNTEWELANIEPLGDSTIVPPLDA